MPRNIESKKPPNILVTGISGYIGKEFLSKIEHLHYVGVRFSSKFKFLNQNVIKADLRDNNQVKEIFDKYDPNILYHFAALTSPTVNEKNVELARESHLGITQNILENISKDAHLIFLSTDKVFDGSNTNPDEEAETNPVWAYGKFKLTCEDLIRKRTKKYHILRLPIVHSHGSNSSGSFIDKALIQIKKREAVKVYDNVYRCYVLLSDLTKIFEKLMSDNHYGTYHVGTKMMSYYERLIDMCQKNEIKYEGLIQPVSGSAKPMKQNLNTEKIKTAFRFKFE